VEAFDGAAVPLTGSLSGELAALRRRKASARGSRGKKVYGITDRGEALFEELLATENQSSFHLRLAFARYLPPDARLGMLERRRAQLLERLTVVRSRLKAAKDSYTRSLMEHDHEAAEHDLSWIERLIASERAGGQPAIRSTSRRSRNKAAADSRGAAAPPSISGLRPDPFQEETI
jgi:DNA-binding PadR family transcriptional regulator